MKNVKLKNLRPGDIIMKTEVLIQDKDEDSWLKTPLRVRGVVGNFLFIDYVGLFDKWTSRTNALNFDHGRWVRVPERMVKVNG